MPDTTTVSQWAQWAQIISLPVAVITIAVSVWLWYRSRQKRALACEFNSIVSPVEIKAGEALAGDIEIRYRGENVDNLFLIQATVRNTGNLAIWREHVIRNIVFNFGPDVELLRSPRVIDTKPKGLDVNWHLTEIGRAVGKPSSIGLDFGLLNPEDELTAEFLCTGKSQVPDVTARIEGVQEIEVVDSEAIREERLRRVSLVQGMANIFVVFAIFLIVPRSELLSLPWPLFIAILLLVSLGVPLFTMLRQIRRKRSQS